MSYTNKTISNHIDYLADAFLISKASRYDIKGRKYIGANLKYYFTDLGLRNARLNFRQQEPTHIMENIVYNELLIRGYNVDVGVVQICNIPDSFKKIVIVNGTRKKVIFLQCTSSTNDREKMKHNLSS